MGPRSTGDCGRLSTEPRGEVNGVRPRARPVLFRTVPLGPKPHDEAMRVLPLIGDAVSALLIVLAVPVAVLAVGTPVALTVKLVLWAFGLQ
jgi:hypothetical protein